MSAPNRLPTPHGLIYHLFPLGVLGAPRSVAELVSANNPPKRTLSDLADWVPHIRSLGSTAVLLGPVWSSESHGYDTTDLYTVDPRIGNDDDLRRLVASFHAAGISVLIDAVFNHVGRSFFAFKDVLERGERSAYADWFAGLDFSQRGPMGEPFSYDTWDGHASLIKLDTRNDAVREYLLGAVTRWITDFGFDGMRLDAADVIDPDFWPILRTRVDTLYHPPVAHHFGGGRFWMFGEMVHGDYRQVAFPGGLDSATNFECYKGLYSSLNDANFFEIGWSLKRQFGDEGIYRGLPLVSFVDNHDVKRIASTLNDERDLFPLHLLLFTIPGVPTIYYGSEFATKGEKGEDDWPLRPPMYPAQLGKAPDHKSDLKDEIARIATIRSNLPALESGRFRELAVSHQQYLFAREEIDQTVYVAVNAADTPQAIHVPEKVSGFDQLNDESIEVESGATMTIPPKWGRIIV